ncbi:MAG: hypothetical protein QG652_31 [Pseudomonadota bacterium]|nr:hypothetical protein [Pseudomonadota bacterium]
MPTLRNKLAEYGFDSPENHDYAVQRFLTNPVSHVRCLNIEGDAGRRRTAFAHALAQALETCHVLYFEFDAELPKPSVVRVREGEDLPPEPPTSAFDRIMTEACALSEAETTVLILDQMHKSPFREHIRLYEFIKSNVWAYSDVRFYANVSNLQIYMISAEPVYHSLQQHSFRIRVGMSSAGCGFPSATEAGLDESYGIWLEPLNKLLEQLGVSPSLQQYRRLVFDVANYARSREQLRVSVYGWIENIDYNRLMAHVQLPYLDAVLEALVSSMDVHEEIEL